jgi:environmental stress-induced protein Ves
MIIRLADCPPQPWKNGLGSTREMAVHPAVASSDNFLWRVSIAEVNSAAPFSCFPGIDRQIVLLDGAGFTMTLDGTRHHALTTPFEPFAFAGETKVDVTLADGATRDFNLMVRREHGRGGVQAWTGPSKRVADPTTMLVFCARGKIDTIDGHLEAGDAWRPSSATNHAVELYADAVALVVGIETRAA